MRKVRALLSDGMGWSFLPSPSGMCPVVAHCSGEVHLGVESFSGESSNR